MTHEAEPGIEQPDDPLGALDVEAVPYEEFLAKNPDDRPDDEELVRGAMENSRG
jgi:hypothetical protein